MNPDLCILLLRHWPAIINVGQTADVLGLRRSAIAILMAAGLLKPLGRPAPNGEKLFASVVIRKLSQDPEWLSKAVLAVERHWVTRNARARVHKKENQKNNSAAPAYDFTL